METTANTVRTFTYRAQTAKDGSVTGTIDAAGGEAARELLVEMQLLEIDLTEGKSGLSQTPMAGESAQNNKSAPQSQANLQLARNIRLLGSYEQSGRRARRLRQLADRTGRDLLLDQAWEGQLRAFPRRDRPFLRAAAVRDRLPILLAALAQHRSLVWRRAMSTTQKITGPLTGVVILTGLLLIVAGWIVPKFEKIFDDFNTSLPTLTCYLMDTSRWICGTLYPDQLIPGWWWVVLVDLAILGFGLFRYAYSRRSNANLKFCDALSISLAAGLDLVDAIPMACEYCGSSQLRREGTRLAEALRRGAPTASVGSLRVLDETTLAMIGRASVADGADLQCQLRGMFRQWVDSTQSRIEGRLPTHTMMVLVAMVAMAGFGMFFTIVSLFLPLVKLIETLT